MRKKMIFAVFSVVVILALAVSPVGAVTDGELDGEGHPFVGLMRMSNQAFRRMAIQTMVTLVARPILIHNTTRTPSTASTWALWCWMPR